VKRNITLVIISLLSILLMTVHLTQDTLYARVGKQTPRLDARRVPVVVASSKRGSYTAAGASAGTVGASRPAGDAEA
jgi:hypothetical protein